LEDRVAVACSLSEQKEYLFRRFLQGCRQANVNPAQAHEIGHKIRACNWQNLARWVCERSISDTRWLPAKKACISILPLYERLKYFSWNDDSGVNQDEWWETFKQTSIELYSTYHSIKTLFLHLNFEISDLRSNASANEIWADVIRTFRNGKYRPQQIKQCLSQQTDDFPHNTHLKFLQETASKILK
ncbi:MAG: hypothetical protein AAF570_20790, partial [Bacteroidota bacterium]